MNMILFQVSLNFYRVKEILKIRSRIYILIKKVIILRKIQHVTMKSFALPFSSIEKTKHTHASAADVLHTVLEYEISIGANADIAKTKQEK